MQPCKRWAAVQRWRLRCDARSFSLKQVDLLCVSNCGATLAVGLMADGAGTSAKRRRERRLVLRHERQTVAVELAAALHHSRDGGRETNYGLRAPKTASPGRRPGVLTEREPQGQERQRTFLRRSQAAPEPQPLLHLGVGEVHNGPLVSFFIQRALQERREEEERRKLEEQEELNSPRAVPPKRRTPQQVQRITDIFRHRWVKRKRKKRRKDLLSLSSWPRSTSSAAVACSFYWFCW